MVVGLGFGALIAGVILGIILALFFHAKGRILSI